MMDLPTFHVTFTSKNPAKQLLAIYRGIILLSQRELAHCHMVTIYCLFMDTNAISEFTII